MTMSCSHCSQNASAAISQEPALHNSNSSSSNVDKSFYMRPLPSELVDFTSRQGKELFCQGLVAGTMECYFPLAQQFVTQNEPAYCGAATLAMVLNALAIDPQRVWKYPWRWYTEDMLSTCDTRKPADAPLHNVDKLGMSFEEFGLLAECNGARVLMFRSATSSLCKFRTAVMTACKHSDVFLVVSYSRKLLKQTGTGHYSPIAGYNAEQDKVLILDVARFKYSCYWVPVTMLWESTAAVDETTSLSRGYFLLSRNDCCRNHSQSTFITSDSHAEIGIDKHAASHLVDYFCRELPKQLSSVASHTASASPVHVFIILLQNLPVVVSSVFVRYTLELIHRANICHCCGSSQHTTSLNANEHDNSMHATNERNARHPTFHCTRRYCLHTTVLQQTASSMVIGVIIILTHVVRLTN